MSFKLSYRQEPKYLFVKISGQWTARSAEEAVEAVHDEAQKRGLTRLLIDTSEISQPDSELTRFRTGEYWAKILGPPFKGSFVITPDLYNGFAETVALNRGAVVATFFEEPAAVDWLLQQSGETPPSAARHRR